MTNPIPRAAWKDWLPIACALVGPLALINGSLRADGKSEAQVQDNTRRIVVLEEESRTKGDLLTKIDGRTIRIETKLEMIAPTKGDTP